MSFGFASHARLSFSTQPVGLRAMARGFGVTVRSAPIPILLSWIVPAVHALLAPVVFAATGSIVARLAQHRGAVTGQVVLIAVGLVGGELLTPVRSVLYGIAGFQTYSRLGARIMREVAGLPGLAYFEDPRLADLLEAVRVMMAGGPYILVGIMQSQVSLIIGLSSLSFVAARVSWWAPVLVVATAVPGFVQQWLGRGVEVAARLDAIPDLRLAAYHRRLATDIRAAKESRIFGLGGWLGDRQQRFWLEAMVPRWEVRHRVMRGAVALGLVRMIAMAAPFVYAFQRVFSGRLGAGDFTAGGLALATMATQVRWLHGTAGIRESLAYLGRFAQLLDLSRTDPRLRVAGTLAVSRTPSGTLRLESVTFRYPGRDAPVLDGLDLIIPAGRSLALVGVNGAGKSTIVKLLCRFYDPDEGRITIDGVDVADFDVTDLRRCMAVVFQDFTRLPLSARDNVAVGCVDRLGDDDLLRRAATRAGVMSVVEQLPEGWDSVLSRAFGGVDVSDGQWQRIALARVLATVEGRGASILILDEPTAAMDVRVEQDLYEHFRELSRGRTSLVISHRLSTVRMADEIALLEHGRITERGTHEELLAAGGDYAQLWELQAKRFRDAGVVE